MRREEAQSPMAPEPDADMQAFPWRPVIIAALCMTVNAYTLANLFPYVGAMVKHLMGLSSTNESGEKGAGGTINSSVSNVQHRRRFDV